MVGIYANLGPRPVSGGFAIVQPDSVLSINAVEGFPLEDFSADVSRSKHSCTLGVNLILSRPFGHRSAKLRRSLAVAEVRRISRKRR